MVFDSPEEIVRAYFAWADSIGAPALNPVAQEGRIYAAECSGCHHQVRHSKGKGLKVRTEVCGRCGRPWPYEDRYVLRGNLQISTRPGSTEHRLSPWCDIGPVLMRLYEHPDHEWPTRVFCARAIGNMTLREFSEDASKVYTRAPFKWTKDRVALLHELGRAVCSREFTRRGWMTAA
jgi:hypothetical protein